MEARRHPPIVVELGVVREECLNALDVAGDGHVQAVHAARIDIAVRSGEHNRAIDQVR
jgi:hypothetical protein